MLHIVCICLCFFSSLCSGIDRDSYNFAEKMSDVDQQMPFVVVIASYKNEEWVEKNLESVLRQNYENFRVIFVDDCSPDRTFELAQEVVNREKREIPISLIRNETRQKAVYNFYHAIHSCENEEIVVVVDGDDWLKHDGVLQELNRVYVNRNVWATFGSYVTSQDGKLGFFSRPTKKSDLVHADQLRKRKRWAFSHLRTFYAGLYKRIALKDFVLEGNFFPVNNDVLMTYPIIEMAREHTFFIEDILYVYNNENELNDHKKHFFAQVNGVKYITSKLSPYPKLQNEPWLEPISEKAVDLLVWKHGDSNKWQTWLEDVKQKIPRLGTVFVVEAGADKEGLAGFFRDSDAKYVLSVGFPANIHQDFSLESAIRALEQSRSYVCFLNQDPKSIAAACQDSSRVLQFADSSYAMQFLDLKIPILKGSLIDKKWLGEVLAGKSIHSTQVFEGLLQKRVNSIDVGCFLGTISIDDAL